jgi:hypothetical protein
VVQRVAIEEPTMIITFGRAAGMWRDAGAGADDHAGAGDLTGAGACADACFEARLFMYLHLQRPSKTNCRVRFNWPSRPLIPSEGAARGGRRDLHHYLGRSVQSSEKKTVDTSCAHCSPARSSKSALRMQQRT